MKRLFLLVIPILMFVIYTTYAGANYYSYLPVVERPLPTNTPFPTNTPTIPTPTNTPQPQPSPTATIGAPGNCTICSSNVYNCSDFSTQAQAQACHDYCFDQVGFDVHRLDANDDGVACESLPRPDWQLQMP